jgi:hypothetical protein
MTADKHYLDERIRSGQFVRALDLWILRQLRHLRGLRFVQLFQPELFPPPYSTKTFAPGLYDLLVTASDTGPDYMGQDSPSSANFTITFAPTVPIPAAVWLFVTGLLGLRRWLPKGSVASACVEIFSPVSRFCAARSLIIGLGAVQLVFSRSIGMVLCV